MSNELTDVRCPCGAEFQADSYDAGFIAGSGMCQNCDAALPPKDICTCPSGDGSLSHPCPAHPAVEQAGGDRWDALQSIMEWTAAENIPDDRKLCLIRNAARAALAQPSPKCATCNDSGQIVVSGPHYQGEFQPPEYETEPCDMCAQPSPAQAEQAEAERPEVVARVVHSNPVVLGQCGPLNANDELMTVAQHAASVARWAEMFNRVEQQRDAAMARVAELEAHCVRLGQGGAERYWENRWRDADARLQELEKQEPVATVAKVPGEDWNSLDFHRDLQDMQPGTKLYTAPVAQAQHSVPEISGIGRDAEHPRAVVLYLRNEPSEEDMRAIQNFLRAISADVLTQAQHSMPKAWLDVQAERRRQVEAEGWTPEHDDLYCAAELPRAAAAYILNGANDEAPAIWPFSAKWWKPTSARRDLIKAGALILAEIERLDRAAPGKEGNDD
ncbi:TPA: hypothetical protein ACGJ6O_003061 [Pseudomonas aeruginosa]|uniref:hypothetical protein n=1 Tax=Pseudomonas aeruginosa TaxID=287 RepID=UPI0006794ABE|nr:hypothetical protein [Pseudomonas aeruginosa]